MTADLWSVIDVLLILALLVLAGGALHSRSLRQAVLLFIAFGLLVALSWARLRAPDVALAEAAIGAGLAGALLLAALRDTPPPRPECPAEPAGKLANAAVSTLTLLLCAGMGWALLHGLEQGGPERLAGAVAAGLDASGVANPVTAVLLNFRAYDTLLELAVLLVALLGILSLGNARPSYRIAGPVLGGLTAWLVPLLILMAGYQLWVGAHAPGGAFQAGALLAAAGVVLHLSGRQKAGLPGSAALRAVVVAGVGMFLAVGLATLWLGSAFLAYPSSWAGALILLIESFATLAIAATLILAYLGGLPDQWHVTTSQGTQT